jgi:hypothetical protein
MAMRLKRFPAAVRIIEAPKLISGDHDRRT